MNDVHCGDENANTHEIIVTRYLSMTLLLAFTKISGTLEIS